MTPADNLLDALQERAKELSCLYRVNEICSTPQSSLDEIFRSVVHDPPVGWQYPETCFARITVGQAVYEPPGAVATRRGVSRADPRPGRGGRRGRGLLPRRACPPSDEGPFLKEESKLIDTVAERLGQLLLHRSLLDQLHGLAGEPSAGAPAAPRRDWWVILDFLRKTDQHLLDADLAPDDQLPLLERHRRGPGPPAALHARAGAAPRSRRREPARGAAQHRLSRRASPTRSSAIAAEHLASRRDPLVHPEVDQGRHVRLPDRGGGEPGHLRQGDRPGAGPLPPRRPSTTTTSRARSRSSCGSRSSAAS